MSRSLSTPFRSIPSARLASVTCGAVAVLLGGAGLLVTAAADLVTERVQRDDGRVLQRHLTDAGDAPVVATPIDTPATDAASNR